VQSFIGPTSVPLLSGSKAFYHLSERQSITHPASSATQTSLPQPLLPPPPLVLHASIMAPPSTNCTTTDGHTAEARSSANGEGTYESVQNYYGKVLSTSKDLKTSACTASGRPHPEILRLIQKVPAEINEKFYGCGAPIPLGISGRRVLDLGSGSGRDCYVAAALVGESGFVTGVDMTDEQLAVSQKYVEEFCQTTLGYAQPNMKFVKVRVLQWRPR